jgi:hypothetical protein
VVVNHYGECFDKDSLSLFPIFTGIRSHLHKDEEDPADHLYRTGDKYIKAVL